LVDFQTKLALRQLFTACKIIVSYRPLQCVSVEVTDTYAQSGCPVTVNGYMHTVKCASVVPLGVIGSTLP